jgi:hypothetical protein
MGATDKRLFGEKAAASDIIKIDYVKQVIISKPY